MRKHKVFQLTSLSKECREIRTRESMKGKKRLQYLLLKEVREVSLYESAIHIESRYETEANDFLWLFFSFVVEYSPNEKSIVEFGGSSELWHIFPEKWLTLTFLLSVSLRRRSPNVCRSTKITPKRKSTRRGEITTETVLFKLERVLFQEYEKLVRGNAERSRDILNNKIFLYT